MTTPTGKLIRNPQVINAMGMSTTAAPSQQAVTTAVADAKKAGTDAQSTANTAKSTADTAAAAAATADAKAVAAQSTADTATTELNKKFNITGGQVEGSIIAAGGTIVSKSGGSLIEVDSRISGKPRINVSANNGSAWFNQFLQMKSGTLGHINIATAAESGYLICGDTGIIIQWGIVSGSTSTSDYRQFPVSFKSACFQIVASYAEFGDNGMSTACYPTSKSEFIITKRSSTGAPTSGNVRYIAVGY